MTVDHPVIRVVTLYDDVMNVYADRGNLIALRARAAEHGVAVEATAVSIGAPLPAEVDLVLTLPGGGRWAIEVKRSLAPKVERGFHHACEDLQPERRIVVYPGVEAFPLPNGIEVMSLGQFGQELSALR